MDYSKLKGVVPDVVYDQLQDCILKFKLKNPLRLAHFLAQCAHESAGFTHRAEMLNYSRERLLEVFPKYFNESNVDEYAHKSVKIASRVYANRMGNGDEESQEGFKYRGRGYIQLTGKDNYESFNVMVPDNLVTYPELVENKYPLLSAGWFWDSRSLNEWADADDIHTITRKVNGGLTGLKDRKDYFYKYYPLITL